MTRNLRITAGLFLLAGALWLGWQIDFEGWLNPAHLAGSLQSLGPWGPLAVIVVMATAVIIPPIPSLPLDLASGAAFGPLLGTTYAVIGAAIGAIVSFLLGRTLGREGISRLFRIDAVFCEGCSDRHVGLVIFLARLIPVFSFDVVSYGAGLTTVSLRTFSLATIAGMIPPTFAFTYLGSSMPSAEWLLIGSAGLLVALFLFLPVWLKRHRSSRFSRLMFGPVPELLISQSMTAPVCPACGRPVEPPVRWRRHVPPLPPPHPNPVRQDDLMERESGIAVNRATHRPDPHQPVLLVLM